MNDIIKSSSKFKTSIASSFGFASRNLRRGEKDSIRTQPSSDRDVEILFVNLINCEYQSVAPIFLQKRSAIVGFLMWKSCHKI